MVCLLYSALSVYTHILCAREEGTMLNIKFWLVMLIKFNLLRNCRIHSLFSTNYCIIIHSYNNVFLYR